MRTRILGEIYTYIESILPVLGFIGLFFYYFPAVSPGLGWEKNPRIIQDAVFLYPNDVAYFPLTSLAAKAVAWLPLGSAVFRINAFHSFIATVSLYLLYLGIINYSPKVVKTSSSKLLAMITVLGFGISPAYWQAALEAKSNIFTLFFLGLMICFHLKYFETGNLSWLMAAVFIYALSVPHYGAMIIFMPVLILLFYDNSQLKGYGFPARGFQYFFIASLAFFLLLGLSASFTLLFIQAGPESPGQFLVGFFKHLISKENIAPGLAWAGQGNALKIALNKLLTQDISWSFWVLGLPLTLIGGFALWLQNHRLNWALILIIAINCLLFTESNDNTALLPAFYSAFFLMGCGLIFLKTKLSIAAKESLRQMIFLAAIIFMVAGGWWRWENRINLGGYLSTEIFGEELETLPPESVFINYQMGFNQEALSRIYRPRDDVILLNYAEGLNDFQRTYRPTGPGLQKQVDSYFNAGIRVYVEPSAPLLTALASFDFIPSPRLALEVTKNGSKNPLRMTEKAQQQINVIGKKMRHEVAENYLPLVPQATGLYSSLLTDLAGYYNYWGLAGESLALADFTLAVLNSGPPQSMAYSTEPPLSLIASQSLWNLGRYQESEDRLDKLVRKYPLNAEAWLGLANFHLFSGNDKKALETAKIAAELSPENPRMFVTLARSQAKNGLDAAALISYQQAIKNYDPMTQGYELIDIQKEMAMWRNIYKNRLPQDHGRWQE